MSSYSHKSSKKKKKSRRLSPEFVCDHLIETNECLIQFNFESGINAEYSFVHLISPSSQNNGYGDEYSTVSGRVCILTNCVQCAVFIYLRDGWSLFKCILGTNERVFIHQRQTISLLALKTKPLTLNCFCQ